MPNIGFPSIAFARYHLECPLCKKDKGTVSITEPDGEHINLECKTCGNLGTITEFAWDWATPSGITLRDHGRDAAELLTIWLHDNPPSAVTQLGAVARRAEAEDPGA